MSSSSSDTDEDGYVTPGSGGDDHPAVPGSGTGQPSPLTAVALQKHDKASYEFRQFGCQACDRVFWRKVHPIRPEAHCRTCRIHLDPVAPELVIGYASFECQTCGNKFTNNKAMYDYPQPCRNCRTLIFPEEPIGPPPLRYGMVPDSSSDEEITLLELETPQQPHSSSDTDNELPRVNGADRKRGRNDGDSFTGGEKTTGGCANQELRSGAGKHDHRPPRRPQNKSDAQKSNGIRLPVPSSGGAGAGHIEQSKSQQDQHETGSAMHSTVKQQFGCKTCNHVFWLGSTDARALCHSCGSVADRLPREMVIGFGVFKCSCRNTFSSRKAMYSKSKKCRKCGRDVFPEEPIKPPHRQRKTYHHHECSGCETGKCKVIPISRRHDCTGDTDMSAVTTQRFQGRREDEPPNYQKYEQEIDVVTRPGQYREFLAGRLDVYLVDDLGRKKFSPSLAPLDES